VTFPTALFRVLAGALATGVVGWALARFVTEGLSRQEKAAWSFATGLLVQPLLFLACTSVSRSSRPAPLLMFDIALVAASIVVRRPSRSFEAAASPSPRKIRAAVVGLLVLAAAAWLLFFVSAVAEPMWATDYLAMWGLKGKTIFETGFVPRRLFQDPALSWGRPDHPLLVPLSLATLASLSGGWNDQALALLFPVCELATLLAVWGFLARRVSPLAGAAAAALVSLCFPLYRAVDAGMAEIPLALGLVLASCAFLDVLGTGSRSAATRLFVASLLAAWTKPEGTLFVLLLAGILFVKRRLRPVETWKSGGWALVVPPILQASLMLLVARPIPPRDFDPTFLEPRRWSELGSRLATVLARIFETGVLPIWIPVLAIGLFFLFTRRGLADLLLPVLVLQVLGYVAAFSISSFDPVWKVDSCFQRIAATLFPAFALVVGARLGGEEAGQSVGTGGRLPVVARSAIG
jgi:hypothetical protein